MTKIHNEDKYNDTYGRNRMYMALTLKKESGEIGIDIPCEATVRKVMRQIELIHKPRRKPNGSTKANREARKSEDLLKRDFTADEPLKKCATEYKETLQNCGIIQSMNNAGGRCHDNARCESMWARMKDELFYSRNDKSENYTMAKLKTMIWRYYMSYWANRRICTANEGLPPAVKRRLYYEGAILAV